MRFQAGIQILLLITAVVMIFTVIKPKFESIQVTQAEVAAYRNAIDNITQYNARLQQLKNEASTISPDDLAALYRYLPEKVDEVAVGRDIYNMAATSGLLLLDVTPDEPTEIVTDIDTTDVLPMDSALAPADALAEGGPALVDDTGAFVPSGNASPSRIVMSQHFNVQVIGAYDDMKAMLQAIERNDYPLRIVEMSFTVDEEDASLAEYNLVLETYSLASN